MGETAFSYDSVLAVPLWVLALAALLLVAAAVLITIALAARARPSRDAFEQLERAVRGEIGEQARGNRAELAQSIESFSRQLSGNMSSIAQLQNNQIDAFALQLAQTAQASDARLTHLRDTVSADARLNREETGAALRSFGEAIGQQFGQLAAATEQRLGEVRATLETRLKDLQSENASKLEEMRKTVDEKLQTTLHARLGESFKQVSERLEAVQRGLGEMQALAAGVGDLKRVLTNVKTRGTWGEVQLGNLLGQMLVAEQYAANVATVPGSSERVEYAIRLPGLDGSHPVWLPIDAKFPREDYERLIDAQERADATAAEDAGRQLEARIRFEARAIRDKYVSPPSTTDFALLFLPTEGLFAEVIRRPGLADELQRLYRVSVTGPTTLTALLNSLQMGFRTLAIEQRSSEVWVLLGAVKNEFNKFGGVLEKVKRQLDSASNTIDEAGKRTRAIERRLRSVEELPGPAAAGAVELAPEGNLTALGEDEAPAEDAAG